MDTSRIFIGYNLSYEECLLKEQESYYVDLITKKKYEKNEIYENLLIPYSILDPNQKNRLLFQIKRIYQKDRQKMLTLKKLYIGDVGIVDKIIMKNYTGSSIWDFGVELEFSYKKLEEKVLLKKKETSSEYKNITNGIIIHDSAYLIPGDYCLGNGDLEPFIGLLSPNEISSEKPKKWVLEKYNKMYQKGIIE